MTKWTKTKEEYDHVRNIVVNYLYGNVTIMLQNGNIIKGCIVGSNSGNNIRENMNAGLGPVSTSLHGELRVETEDDQTVIVSALDVKHIMQN